MSKPVRNAYPRDLQAMYEQLRNAGALDRMRTSLEPSQPAHYAELEYCVVEACAAALRFQQDPDKSAQRRSRDRQVRERLQRQFKAIKDLVGFLNSYPDYAEPALLRALKYSGVSIGAEKGEHHTPPSNQVQAWKSLLKTYDQCLRALPLNRGAGLHRVQCGPLIYPKPVDARRGNRPLKAETGLVFQLVIYFRGFSKPSPNFARLQSGHPMPKFGQPFFDICAAVLEATFNRVVKPDTLRRRLDRLLLNNKGIGFGGWEQ